MRAAISKSILVILIALPLLAAGCSSADGDSPADATPSAARPNKPPEATVELSASQLQAIKIETVGTYPFPVENETVGNIDFDEDLSVQVLSLIHI